MKKNRNQGVYFWHPACIMHRKKPEEKYEYCSFYYMQSET